MSANIKNENTEHVDLTSILKDVENCIRSGLSNKLDTFFYEYDRYKKTHEEVLNLSIVRELLKRGSSVSEGTKPKLDPELEMIVLRNQVIFLRGEVNKYKNQAEALVLAQAQAPELEAEPESSQLNLEIKEKEPELLDIKSEEQDNGHDDEDVDDGDVLDNDDDDEDEDGDVSETSSEGDDSDDDTGMTNTNTNTNYLSHIVEDSIQNIVLNVTEKDEAEEEAEEEVVTEEEEEEVVAEEEEEEDLPIKMPTFPTKTKPEPAVEVKPVIVEEEEEEDEVETETEEDSDEEEEAEHAPAPELKVSAPEENEEEEEEEELYEVEINGVMYVTNDDEDGTIYSYDNEEVGDKVGEFKGTVAHIYKGKNKGIYDRTMCKMNF